MELGSAKSGWVYTATNYTFKTDKYDINNVEKIVEMIKMLRLKVMWKVVSFR